MSPGPQSLDAGTLVIATTRSFLPCSGVAFSFVGFWAELSLPDEFKDALNGSVDASIHSGEQPAVKAVLVADIEQWLFWDIRQGKSSVQGVPDGLHLAKTLNRSPLNNAMRWRMYTHTHTHTEKHTFNMGRKQRLKKRASKRLGRRRLCDFRLSAVQSSAMSFCRLKQMAQQQKGPLCVQRSATTRAVCDMLVQHGYRVLVEPDSVFIECPQTD